MRDLYEIGCGKKIGWYYKNNQKDKPVLCGDKKGKIVELCSKCLKMKCKLCDLEHKSVWHYEDEFFIVCDCTTCKNMMIVLKRHDTELTPDESKRLIELLTKFAERKRIRFVRRTIPSHFHMHIRTAKRKREC